MLRLLLVKDRAPAESAPRHEGRSAQCGSLAGCRALGDLLGSVDVALVDFSSYSTARGRSSSRSCGEANPSVRVLILTASIELGLQGRMAETGPDGVLNKTAALTQIASEVARLGAGRPG